MKFFLTLDTPWQWALVNAKNEVVDHGEAEQLESIERPKGISEIIGVAPGQAITLRSVMIPGKRRTNVEAAMPYALEDSLSEDVDDLHFTLLDWSPDQAAVVAVVSKQALAGWINDAARAGFALDQVLPGYLLLPQYTAESATVCPVSSEQIYVRSGMMSGFSMDREFLNYWLDEEGDNLGQVSVTDKELALSISKDQKFELRFWDIGSKLWDWLRIANATPVLERFSILHGSFLPPHRSRNYRPLKIAAVLGLVAALGYFVAMQFEVRSLKQSDQMVTQQTRALFRDKFPDEPYLGRPRFQVESLLSVQSGQQDRHGFQALLQGITSVTRKHKSEIEEINFRDDAMIVLCNVSSLSVLDTIRQGLQELPGMNAELLSSGARDNTVTGRFRITRS